jgi:hypothetical protein
MLSPGTYHVIGLGRRYVRHAESGMVGNQLEHAEQFRSHQKALDAARELRAKLGEEGVVVQTVTIAEVEV